MFTREILFILSMILQVAHPSGAGDQSPSAPPVEIVHQAQVHAGDFVEVDLRAAGDEVDPNAIETVQDPAEPQQPRRSQRARKEVERLNL